MIWSKGDRTEMRIDITELKQYEDEEEEKANNPTQTIIVATNNADKLLKILNDYEWWIE